MAVVLSRFGKYCGSRKKGTFMSGCGKTAVPVSALVRQLQNDSAVKRNVSGEWAGIYRCGTAFDVMSGDHRAQCCACEDHNFESDCEVMNLLAHNTRLLIVWLRRRGFGGREALRCGV